ncbi:MAG: NADH-quinone oxidoreductase subunit M [Armatimonadetes bacterium]|nr:NADH-quinone oxidoreductase subunit M [Armatimonadota bacterium]MDW8121972.1 NADH-quinone oxidoreductase subunit M [Armatimonadota bacterium]
MEGLGQWLYDHLLSLILWTPVVGALFILFTHRENVRQIRFWAHVFTFLPLAFSVYLWIAFNPPQMEMQFVETYDWIPVLGIRYKLGVDGLSMPLVVLTALLTFVSVVYSPTAIRVREKEYYALFLLLETGLVGTFMALDFVLFYVFWEVSLVPMYFLIGIWGGPQREYAAIKFFLYTLVGSVAMLLSILILYFHSEPRTFGMTELIEQQPLEGKGILQVLAFLGFYLAFAIKVPVFPFHTWLPDAHVEAPTAGSVLLAGILLKMGTYGFVRISLPLLPEGSQVFWAPMGVLGLINIIYGSLVAMAQDDLKKLVAYSSIGHMGFVMLGIAAAAMDGRSFTDPVLRDYKVIALNGATFQMIAHGLMTGAMFLLVGVIYERAHHRDINRFGGLWSQMVVYGSLFSFFSMGELGLPGLAGFWGEFLAVLGAFQLFAWAGLAVIGIVITAAYFLWTVQRMFLGEPKEAHSNYPDMNLQEHISLWPLAVLTFLAGVYPKGLLTIIQPAMESAVEKMTKVLGGG